MIPAIILSKLLAFAKRHWKLLAILAAVALAFFLGWVLKPEPPAKITEHVEYKEKLVLDEQRIEAEVQRRVREIEVKLQQHVVETKVTKPDGTKVETKVTDTKIDSHDKEVQVVEKVVEVEKKVYVDREVEKKVVVDAPRKDWIVGPMVGIDVRNLGLRDGALQTGPLAFGGMVQRRIVGPVFGGVYALHNGTAGLTVQFEF